MRYILIMLLVLAGLSTGATYYVDKSAADDNGAGGEATPKKYPNSGSALLSADGDVLNISADTFTGTAEIDTAGGTAFTYFLVNQAGIANDDVIIQPWAGVGAGTLNIVGSTFDAYVSSDGGSVTFKDFTMSGASITIYNEDGSTKNCIVDNMILGLSAKTGRAFYGGVSDVSLTNRQISVSDSTLYGSFNSIASSLIDIQNSIIDSASTSYYAVHLDETIGDVLVKNNIMTQSGSKGGVAFFTLNPSVAISTITDYSGTVAGTIKILTAAVHGVVTGNLVAISGTTSYNGQYRITRIDTDEFYCTKEYVADETAGKTTELSTAGDIRVIDNTITRAQTSGIIIYGARDVDSVEIEDNVISSTAATGVTTGIRIGYDYHNIPWVVGIAAKDGTGDTPAYPTHTIHMGRYFYCISDHTSEAGSNEPGVGTTWTTYWSEYGPIDFVRIANNSITNATDGQAHCILVGSPVRGADITGNFLEGGDFGLVVKAHACTITSNICFGPSAISIIGGQDNSVRNNTAVSASANPACIIAPTGIASNGTKLENNVFVNTSTGYCLQIDAAAGDIYCDYNCYYKSSETGYLANIKGTDCATLLEIQQAWDAAGYPDNDEHSIVVNPQLDANYQARNAQLKAAGSPMLIKSDGTVLLRNDIGATKFAGGKSGGLFGGSGIFGN